MGLHRDVNNLGRERRVTTTVLVIRASRSEFSLAPFTQAGFVFAG
jgi:hypothetical protein